jgi:hypothetical protein
MNITTMSKTQTPLDITTVERTTFVNDRINSFYWQDQIDILPQVKVNVGGRFDDYKRNVTRVGGFPFRPRSRDQNAYSYRAGIVYAPRYEVQLTTSRAPALIEFEKGQALSFNRPASDPYPADSSCVEDVFERIRVQQNHVGALAVLQAAKIFFHPQTSRAFQRRDLQRLLRRQTGLYHLFELEVFEIAMKTARRSGIGAQS